MTPIQNLADNLAALGRYEDTYMVHAAEGETVVPRDVSGRESHPQDGAFCPDAVYGH
jgi:hypothetical protein